MSIFDYLAAMDGVSAEPESAALTEAEKDDLWNWIQSDSHH